MPLTIFTSDRFADHLNPPGHPERFERAEVMRVVAQECRASGSTVVEPVPAQEEQICRVHDDEYVAFIRETAGRATALDLDTYTSPDTFEVARLAAGAAIGAVDHVLDSQSGARGLAIVRPPGHHAERKRAMGFCVFNNVAVAAAHARAGGVQRVAIVDYDVHHGNGTQRSFYGDPAVLFVSSHQFPFYPGTGAAREVGQGAGQGFTVNLPLEAGSSDADYALVYREVVLPVLRQFDPELILISAGFDAHEDDPLGGMRLTTGQFGRLTGLLAGVADECCRGRLVAVTEGGYDLPALAASLRGVATSLSATPTAPGGVPAGPAHRGEATAAVARSELSKFWTI